MKEHTKTNWKVDPGHSEVQFKVKHMTIANVSGTFDIFQGTVETQNEDFEGAQVNFEMDADSLSTNNKERDKHLKSELFFEVEHFPKLLFNGQIVNVHNGYLLDGELTIRDTSKKVQLAVAYNGIGKGRFGDIRAGFELSGQINRKDFGLTWNMVTEAGGIVIGEDIKLHMDIQLIKE